MNLSRSSVEPESQLVASSTHRDGEKIAHVRYLLGRNDVSPGTVRSCLVELTDAELMSFGLSAYRMNLLSLFGERWTRQQINQTARDAAINKLWFGWQYFHHYLPRLTAAPGEPQLDDFPVDLIKQLLRRGRGLVVAAFHQGHFRHIASDLAIAGIPTSVLLDRASIRDFELARATVPPQALRAYPKVVGADEVRGCFELARTLAKGGCVHAMLDGNTGLDGTRGDSHRAVVDILGCRARVKIGLIKLAAQHGTPILPIFAPAIHGRQRCYTAPLIDPAQPLPEAQAASFAAAAARELYQHFVQNLLARPADWNGCDHFHLWRVPDVPRSQQIEAAEQQLTASLSAGGKAMLNGSRIIVDLSRDSDFILTDVRTLRCCRIPNEMTGLLARLNPEGGGVDVAWLAGQDAAQRSRMWRFMLQMASRDVIKSYGTQTAALTA